jgi:hypothetical protein
MPNHTEAQRFLHWRILQLYHLCLCRMTEKLRRRLFLKPNRCALESERPHRDREPKYDYSSLRVSNKIRLFVGTQCCILSHKVKLLDSVKVWTLCYVIVLKTITGMSPVVATRYVMPFALWIEVLKVLYYVARAVVSSDSFLWEHYGTLKAALTLSILLSPFRCSHSLLYLRDWCFPLDQEAHYKRTNY